LKEPPPSHEQLKMTTSLTSPLPDASPAAVRGYFTTLLHTLHSVPEPEAARIAVKWQFGRGSELRYYDITTFREIFGVEAGTVLFGHARGELGNGGNGLGKGGSGAGQVGNVGVGMRIVRGKEKPAKDIFGITPGCEFSFNLFNSVTGRGQGLMGYSESGIFAICDVRSVWIQCLVCGHH
jgi:hypothetical protein